MLRKVCLIAKARTDVIKPSPTTVASHLTTIPPESTLKAATEQVWGHNGLPLGIGGLRQKGARTIRGDSSWKSGRHDPIDWENSIAGFLCSIWVRKGPEGAYPRSRESGGPTGAVCSARLERSSSVLILTVGPYACLAIGL